MSTIKYLQLFSTLIILFLVNNSLFSQHIEEGESKEYPQGHFAAPVDIPMLLSGNFGEMRTNHFHTGIDIKTQGKTGLNIRSIDDGHVSRIRVGLYGYGNALYVDHPNGYTSVYAHLSEFSEEITAFLRDAQYNLEEYTVDLYPTKGQLQVSRNDIIAKSGNTGTSGGPHLHFEIRETITELPVNPLLFDFDIKDTSPPKAYAVMAIPLDENARVNDKKNKQIFDVIGNSKIKTIASKGQVRVSGKVGFAIKTYDFTDGSNNKCGTYEIELFRNEKLIYKHQLEKLDFYTNRFVNAHVVYDYFKSNKSRFQRNYSLPYDELPIYETIINKDDCQLKVDSLYKFRYELADVSGNQSTVVFDVKVEPELTSHIEHSGELFHYDEDNRFQSPGCTVYIPTGRLYDDLWFETKESQGISEAITPLFQISNPTNPLQDEIIIKIECNISDSLLREKAVVVNYDKTKGKISSIGGKYRKGWMEVRTKKFGSYTVMLDTIAPKITNNSFKKEMKGRKSFSFKITDNLSGIKSYRMLIDDKWVLGTYKPRSTKLTYHFDEQRLTHGKHNLLVVITDERGNDSTFYGEFNW